MCAALTVKYITKRFIMEYDPDIGEWFYVRQDDAVLYDVYSLSLSPYSSRYSSSWNSWSVSKQLNNRQTVQNKINVHGFHRLQVGYTTVPGAAFCVDLLLRFVYYVYVWLLIVVISATCATEWSAYVLVFWPV